MKQHLETILVLPGLFVGLFCCLFLCGGCAIGRPDLLSEPPPLADMEEPLDLFVEPDDEELREALPPGSFTGIHAADRARSLDAMLQGGEGVLVASVVENSPADVGGVLAGDVILEARADTRTVAPSWPSEWRALELETPPGTRIDLVVDRAAKELELSLTTTPRARPAGREETERFREEEKIGIVVRTATEVEARAAGLGPGGGAVVVGLARGSPWREVRAGEDARAGLVYGDLIASIGGAEVSHPQVLIDAIRARDEGDEVEVGFHREGEMRTLALPVSARASHVREVSIPVLFNYTSDRGHSETSILLGLYKHERTRAAWRTRILWIIRFGAGDSDRLEEVRS